MVLRVRMFLFCVQGASKIIICLLTKTERDFSKVRDLLLWQDVYVWEGLGGAGGVSSSQVGKQSLSQKSLDLITP